MQFPQMTKGNEADVGNIDIELQANSNVQHCVWCLIEMKFEWKCSILDG